MGACLSWSNFHPTEDVIGQNQAALDFLLQLEYQKADIDCLFRAFADIDADNSHVIRIDEFFAYFSIESTPCNRGIFSWIAKESNHEVQCLNFFQFAVVMWNFLTIDKEDLPKFVFFIFDVKDSGQLQSSEIIELVKTIYHTHHSQSKVIRQLLRKLELENKSYSVDAFTAWTKSHHSLLNPLFSMQKKLRQKIIGYSYWNSLKERRRKHPEFGSIRSLHYIMSRHRDIIHKQHKYIVEQRKKSGAIISASKIKPVHVTPLAEPRRKSLVKHDSAEDSKHTPDKLRRKSLANAESGDTIQTGHEDSHHESSTHHGRKKSIVKPSEQIEEQKQGVLDDHHHHIRRKSQAKNEINGDDHKHHHDGRRKSLSNYDSEDDSQPHNKSWSAGSHDISPHHHRASLSKYDSDDAQSHNKSWSVGTSSIHQDTRRKKSITGAESSNSVVQDAAQKYLEFEDPDTDTLTSPKSPHLHQSNSKHQEASPGIKYTKTHSTENDDGVIIYNVPAQKRQRKSQKAFRPKLKRVNDDGENSEKGGSRVNLLDSLRKAAAERSMKSIRLGGYQSRKEETVSKLPDD